MVLACKVIFLLFLNCKAEMKLATNTEYLECALPVYVFAIKTLHPVGSWCWVCSSEIKFLGVSQSLLCCQTTEL